MAFHFPLMPRMFMAIAQEDRYPIYDIMRQTPPIPENAQWAIFLRNHDELTLEMVSESERSLLYSVYAAETRARLNVGIRRRLAPLMDNDRRKIELLASLLLSMPGTPVIYYGDEIGMGDNIYLGDRDGVRTPMQWSPDRNGGFSRADAQRLYLPIVADPLYGYNSVNVEAQMRSPSSLLNWVRRMIAVRQAHKVFGRGKLAFLHPENRHVIAYTRELDNEIVLCVANLAHTSQPVTLDLSPFLGRTPIEMLDWSTFPSITDDRYVLTLPGHAFFWFFLADRVAEPVMAPPILPPEFVTLVIPRGWRDLVNEPSRTELEEEVLPLFLRSKPWYEAGDDHKPLVHRITETIALDGAENPSLLALIEARDGTRPATQYSLPLALSYDDRSRAPSVARLAFARARSGPREALIYDAVADDRFWLRLTDGLRGAERVAGSAGTLGFDPTWSFDGLEIDRASGVRRIQEPRNLHDDAVVIGNAIALKLYRHIEAGIHPEVELGRFLHEAAFEHAPPMLGAIEYTASDGTRYAVGVAHRFVESQGDAWRVTLNFLERMLERSRTMAASGERGSADGDDTQLYGRPAFALGQTLADLHRTLAAGEGPNFAPEPFEAKDVEEVAWVARQRVDFAFDTLERSLRSLPEALVREARALLARHDDLVDRIAELAAVPHRGHKQRIHGRFHLGNVLVTERGVLIVGFDGDRRRPFAARRDKTSPLEDLAGVLQSFDYAEMATLAGLTADRTEDLSRFAPEFAQWKRRATAAFLAGYHRTSGATIDRDLLHLYRLDRTLYSIVYENANRPSWLTIPIRSIAAVLDRSET
jgi:maltose alpha-D-glucosyltransferase/alpha-amylase